MDWYTGKGQIWPLNLTLILIFTLSSIFNQVNCEAVVFKGDQTIPKSVMSKDEIRRLTFLNRPRQPRQDDGDDGGEEETVTMMPGLGSILNNLFGMNSALGQLPQVIRTVSSIGMALETAFGGNRGGGGGGGGGLPNFLTRNNNGTGNIFQQITGQMGEGPQSILQILEANRRPIGGVLPNRGPPGAVNGAAAAQAAQMELLLMTMMTMQQNAAASASGQQVGAPSVNPDLQNQLVKLAIQQQTQQLLNGPGAQVAPEDYSVEDFHPKPFPTEAPRNPPRAPPAPPRATSAPVPVEPQTVAAPVQPQRAPSVSVGAPSASEEEEPNAPPPRATIAPSRSPPPPTAPPSAPRSTKAPQIFKELAQLAAKLPNQGNPALSSSESEIIPNLWELYAQLQNLPQYQSTPSPAISPSTPNLPSPTPINLQLFQQAISQYPALFSLALLQSINAAYAIQQNQNQNPPQTNPQPQQPQVKPQVNRRPPTPSPYLKPTRPRTTSPFFNGNPNPPQKQPLQEQQTNPELVWKPPTISPYLPPTPSPTQPPSWASNEPYAPTNPRPYAPSTQYQEPQYAPAPTPTPTRRPSFTPPPQPPYRPPTSSPTHIYTGSLHALKAQTMNQRPEDTQGPHFVKSPTSSQLTLPIGGYVPSVVSVFEGVDSQKQVGPQPDIHDEFNGFGHRAPYTPIKSGILIDTPRLPHSPHDLVRRPLPPSGGSADKQTSQISPENSQKLPEFSFQANKVNNVVRQPQPSNYYEVNYGAVHTTTTTRRPTQPPPPPPPPPPPHQSPQSSGYPSQSTSWIAAIKEIQSRPVSTPPAPSRYRTRPTTKKPSLISGPIYWMNMYYPKGVSTEKYSAYKFEK